MNLHGMELFGELQQANNERELFLRLVTLAGEMGFEHVCYGLQAPLPIVNPLLEIFDTYPTGWMDHYRESGFLAVDPTVSLGKRSPLPIVWSDQTFVSASRMWDDARGFGLTTGISQSNWAANGVFGVLSLARSSEQVTLTEMRALSEQLGWLTGVTHALMTNFFKPRFANTPDSPLTAREREVLQWSAEGKTAMEIGMILSVAERTVNFHINNILVKLNATNKIQAAVRAALLGFI